MAFEYAVVLTGSIATGKSTVANLFSFYGWTIIDADAIAHEILDEEHEAIVEMFGEALVENYKVNRKKLGAIVFTDTKKKKALENLLHPLIYKKIVSQSNHEDQFDKPYIIDIPLFFESKRYDIDKSLVVYTPKKQQLARLMEREGFTQEEAMARIDTQIDIEIKRKKATYVISNEGDLTTLKYECQRVKEQILKDFV